MSFTISNTLVQEIRDMSPLKPIRVDSMWWDDDRGRIAQVVVIHGKLSILINISKKTSKKSFMTELGQKMLHWHKLVRKRIGVNLADLTKLPKGVSTMLFIGLKMVKTVKDKNKIDESYIVLEGPLKRMDAIIDILRKKRIRVKVLKAFV